MHKGIGVVAVLLLIAVAGCGSGASSRSAGGSTVKSHVKHRCPSGTVSINENGKTHCLATHSTGASASSETASYVNIPQTLQVWPKNTPVWHSFAKVTLPFAWIKWQPLLRAEASLGLVPKDFQGIGFNPTIGAAAGANLYLSSSFDGTEWVSIQLPSAWSTPTKASRLAQWSVTLLTKWTHAMSTSKHPNLVLRWMIDGSHFIQVGRTGTTTDQTLASGFGQVEGWAITKGHGAADAITASTQLLSPPASLVPSDVPQSDWVYSSSDAVTWLTQVLEQGSPQGRTQPSSSTTSSPSSHLRSVSSSGMTALVPVGWKSAPLTGGDWSGTKWVNPQNPDEEEIMVTSGCVGCYYPNANTGRSPNPRLVVPASDAVNQFIFNHGLSDGYSFYASGNPYEGQGVVTVSTDKKGYGYVEVFLPGAQKSEATAILNSFRLTR